MSEHKHLKAIAEQVAASLSYVRVRNHSAYVATPLLYANGTGVLVRIDIVENGYSVSDDGYGAFIAETMSGLPTYSRIASSVAEILGVRFEGRTFFAEVADADHLPAAAAAIANASARANDRMVQSLEAMKLRRSRDLFDDRLRAAFGSAISFDVTVKGNRGREWDYDAAATIGERQHLFAFVGPAFTAVASANIKIGDTLARPEPPDVTAVLADYNRTEPALRAILADTGSIVIGASDDVEHYRLVAA